MADLIDREILKKELIKRWDRNDDHDFSNKEVWEALKNAPSAEPKKGKWVQTNPPERSDNIVCDQCGYDSIAKFIYCPNCGAKMEVTE